MRYVYSLIAILSSSLVHGQESKTLKVRAEELNSGLVTPSILLCKVKNGIAWVNIELDSNGAVSMCEVTSAMYEKSRLPDTKRFFSEEECLHEVDFSIKAYLSKLKFVRSDGAPFKRGHPLKINVPIE